MHSAVKKYGKSSPPPNINVNENSIKMSLLFIIRIKFGRKMLTLSIFINFVAIDDFLFYFLHV